MNEHHPLSVQACGAPTLFSLTSRAEGGYTIMTVHHCRIVPPCTTYNVWGPFEDLELAVQTRELVWPYARPGNPEDFPTLDP